MKYVIAIITVALVILNGSKVSAQWTTGTNINNTNTGNVGIGITTPLSKLQVSATAATSHNSIITVTGLDLTYDVNKTVSSTPFYPTIGLGTTGAGDNIGGLTWFNNGYTISTGFVTNNRLLWRGAADATQRSFMLCGTDYNFGGYSLELRNNGATYVNDNYWISKPSSANIVSWRKPLNIGTYISGEAVRIFSDNQTLNKIADIFVQNSKVGIGTETPNTNAKLHVIGNIFTDAKIVIGTTDMTKVGSYSLAVNGDAIMNKVRIKQFATWADFVFDKEYRLLPLEDVEKFIIANKHLPAVPTAKEVENEGIDLGSTQTLLLQKIEELTLYAIEQNKKSTAQQEQINGLVKELEAMKLQQKNK